MRVILITTALAVALSPANTANSQSTPGESRTKPEESLIQRILAGDVAATDEAGRSGDRQFIPYLRQVLKEPKNPEVVRPAGVALARLGEIDQLQEVWCNAIADEPKRRLKPSTYELESVGGWFAIQGLEKLLTPDGLIHWHTPSEKEKNNDALAEPLSLAALKALRKITPNPPPQFAGSEWDRQVKLWQDWIAARKDELSKLQPTGQGVDFSPNACKKGKPAKRVSALTSFVFAQQKPSAPFHIKLLPGYNLKQAAGTDTRTGEISKHGGLLIRYDMGGDLPTTEERKAKPVQLWNRLCTWKKDGYPDPKTDAADVLCWIDVEEGKHQKTLHVSFPDITEFWTKVKNQRQIDEALKMLLTYDPIIQPK